MSSDAFRRQQALRNRLAQRLADRQTDGQPPTNQQLAQQCEADLAKMMELLSNFVDMRVQASLFEEQVQFPRATMATASQGALSPARGGVIAGTGARAGPEQLPPIKWSTIIDTVQNTFDLTYKHYTLGQQQHSCHGRTGIKSKPASKCMENSRALYERLKARVAKLPSEWIVRDPGRLGIKAIPDEEDQVMAHRSFVPRGERPRIERLNLDMENPGLRRGETGVGAGVGMKRQDSAERDGSDSNGEPRGS